MITQNLQNLNVKFKRIILLISASLVLQGVQLHAQTEDEEDVVGLSDLTVTDNSSRLLPTEPSESSFGFSKPILETPRSVSLISEEAIELYGLSAVEDLVTLVPGVFTTTRFGIQGSIDVRNVSADTYFRGMKRVNLQGHTRSVLAAMDRIEVVKGPPSPLYGMGKIGGYTNMTPKSGRAQTGAYLVEPQGFSQLILGSFDRREFSMGVGGPLPLEERDGGYYVYGLIEDSGTHSRDVDVKQKILQGAITVDNVIGPFRLETGVNYQRSQTQGSLIHRLTQNLVDDLEYIRGVPLANLDINGDGKIGYYEMHEASPVQGAIRSRNEPLRQRWIWPTDASGDPIPLGDMPTVPGIPQSMFDYLTANPEADPDGLLRAQGVGGPLPQSGYVPLGFVLDPRTVGYDTLDPRKSGALERELQADLRLAYIDLVYDSNPDFTMKNQFFVDNIDQYKISEQPGGGKQDVLVLEDKFTVTKRLFDLPSWLEVNTLGSVNFRYTKATGYRYGGDFSSHRMDLMAQVGPMTPNTTFASPFDNNSLDNGGATWSSDYRTVFTELGAGVLLDIDMFDSLNLMLGGRYDTSHAKNTEFAGTFNPNTGTSADPGAFRTSDRSNSGRDDGFSWSASATYGITDGINPYATIARASVALDTNNNRVLNDTIEEGHVGAAELLEFGVKGNILGGKAFFSLAHYEQTRTSVSEEDPGSVLGAEVSSTRTKGIEAELKFVPMENLLVSVYGLNQETKFNPNGGGDIMVDARTLGFQDVLDADGNVVYPAEAFLYGGRAYIRLPDDVDLYETKRGNPETQFGINANYRLDNGLGFTLSGNAFSSVYSGRLQTVKLPAVETLNLGVYYDADIWNLKFDVRNVTDERYWRSRTGDSLGDMLVQAMPGRTFVATVKVKF